jgi:hypothetical protein
MKRFPTFKELKIHYNAHKSLPLGHTLSQLNPVHSFTLQFFKILSI